MEQYCNHLRANLLKPLLEHNSEFMNGKANSLPKNGSTKESFTGINLFHLLSKQTNDNQFLGKKQIEQLGGALTEGAEPTNLMYWQTKEKGVDGQVIPLERPKLLVVPVYATDDVVNLPIEIKTSEKKPWNIDTAIDFTNKMSVVETGKKLDLGYLKSEGIEVQQKTILNLIDTINVNKMIHDPIGSKDFYGQVIKNQLVNLMIVDELGIDRNTDKSKYANGVAKLINADPLFINKVSRDASKHFDNTLSKINELSNSIPLKVAFSERSEASAMGARWNDDSKTWYVPNNLAEEKQQALIAKYSQDNTQDNNKTYINVAFEEKDEARSMGAQWDKEVKSWYVPNNLTEENQAQLFNRFGTEFMTTKQIEGNQNKIEEANMSQKNIASEKLFFQVDYKDKAEAYNLGARWDKNDKAWVVYKGTEFSSQIFKKFAQINQQDVNDKNQNVANEKKIEADKRTYINVSIKEKDDAKSMGAQWDKEARSWYIPDELSPENFQALKDKYGLADLEKIESARSEIRTNLAISYEESGNAKKQGHILWDKSEKTWYVMGDVPEGLKQYLPENVALKQQMPGQSSEDQFKDFLKENGFDIGKDSIVSGKHSRAHVEGDKGKERSGYYVFYENASGIAGGFIHNHRTQQKSKWSAKQSVENKFSPEEMKLRQEQIARDKEVHRKLVEETQNKIASIARKEIDVATPINLEETEYTKRKLISAYSGTFKNDRGTLLVPAQNVDGEIRNIQYVNADGSKIFKKDAQKNGCFHLMDSDKFNDHDFNRSVIVVTEGYATASTVYDALDKEVPVVSAFDAHNMVLVSQALHEKYPNAQLVIACDNDHHLTLREKPLLNSGVEAGKQIEQLTGATIVIPALTKAEIKKELSDWNDLVCTAKSKEVGKQRVASSIKPVVQKLQQAKAEQLVQQKVEEQKMAQAQKQVQEQSQKKSRSR